MSAVRRTEEKQIPPFTPDGRTKPDKAPASFKSLASSLSAAPFEKGISPIATRFQEKVAFGVLSQDIREADEMLNGSSSLLAVMADKLKTIVKNYPPFPADSSERAALLQSFSALRQQIEQIALSPEDKQKAEAALGALGKIPYLKDLSADKEIEDTLSALEAARERLAEARSQLIRDASETADAVSSSTSLLKWLEEQGIKIAILDDEKAEKTSREAGAELKAGNSRITTSYDVIFLLR